MGVSGKGGGRRISVGARLWGGEEHWALSTAEEVTVGKRSHIEESKKTGENREQEIFRNFTISTEYCLVSEATR